jgi:mRNA-degrading endonuclease RelE of RelBE toxin-antitoxin system
MSFEVVATEPFKRKLKRLLKKHRSLKNDLGGLIDELSENPEKGTPLGNDCYKIRLRIASKGKGKSGGARVITYVKVAATTIFLIDIYDKSEQGTLTDTELKQLVRVLNPPKD